MFKDKDSADEIISSRGDRFAEEVRKFEDKFGISLHSEVGEYLPETRIHEITSGKIDVVTALSQHDLWYVLLSLHIDLRYVLWAKEMGTG